MLKENFVSEMKAVLLSTKKDLLIKTSVVMEIDSDGDDTDEIQANAILAVDKHLSNRNVQYIRKIDQALDRIAEKTYGCCEDCEEDIPEKRLLLNPCFETCVLCAEKREILNRR